MQSKFLGYDWVEKFRWSQNSSIKDSTTPRREYSGSSEVCLTVRRFLKPLVSVFSKAADWILPHRPHRLSCHGTLISSRAIPAFYLLIRALKTAQMLLHGEGQCHLAREKLFNKRPSIVRRLAPSHVLPMTSRSQIPKSATITAKS